jgi:tetratricopeptide (TPR) repeat protein
MRPMKLFYSLKEKLFGKKKSYLELLAEAYDSTPSVQKEQKYLSDLVNKGISLCEQSQKANPIENLENAIQCFQEAISRMDQNIVSSNLASVKTNLAIAHFYLSKYKDSEKNLDDAYELFLITSDFEYKKQNFQSYGTIQLYLGDYFYELAKEDDVVDNCNKSILHYLTAQKVLTPKQYPQMQSIITDKLNVVQAKLSSELSIISEDITKNSKIFKEMEFITLTNSTNSIFKLPEEDENYYFLAIIPTNELSTGLGPQKTSFKQYWELKYEIEINSKQYYILELWGFIPMVMREEPYIDASEHEGKKIAVQKNEILQLVSSLHNQSPELFSKYKLLRTNILRNAIS